MAARLTAGFKRATLSAIYRRSIAQATPLLLCLQSLQDHVFESVESGREVTAHSGAGKSTQFALPQIWRTLTSEEMFELSDDFLTAYSSALATLKLSQTGDQTQDQAIFNQMIASLPTITSVGRDFSALRWPTRL